MDDIIKNEISGILKGEFSKEITFIDYENYKSRGIFSNFSEIYDPEIAANVIAEESHCLIPLNEIENEIGKKIIDGTLILINNIVYKLNGKPEITEMGMANIKLKLHNQPV